MIEMQPNLKSITRTPHRSQTTQSKINFNTNTATISDEIAVSPTSNGYKLRLSTGRALTQIPSSDEIRHITTAHLTCKKRPTETNFYPESSSNQRSYNMPRLTLTMAKKGLNTGAAWFNPEEDVNLFDGKGSTRFSSRPSTVHGS